MVARAQRAGLSAASTSEAGSGRRSGSPVAGVSFDLFLRSLPRLASVGAVQRRVLAETSVLLDRFLAAIGIDDPVEIEMPGLILRIRGGYANLSPASTATQERPIRLIATGFLVASVWPLAIG